VESDRVALFRGFRDDATFCKEERTDEGGPHGVQEGISVGSVYRGGVLCVERHRLADLVEREIGGVRFAFNLELRKFAAELSRGGQDASNPWKRPEIGVGEFVRTRDGSGARIIKVQGAKIAASVDLAFGFGVCQRSVKAKRLVHAGCTQVEVVNVPFERSFRGF